MYKQFNLLDLLVLIVEKKKTLLYWIVSFTVIATAVAFLLPKKYKSTTQILISTESLPSLGGVLGSFISSSFSNSKIGSEQALQIMNGRSIKEQVIQEFRLDSVYNDDYIEETLKEFSSNLKILDNREGGFGFNPIITIELSFIDEEPLRSQQIVQRYITLLDSTMLSLNKTTSNQILEVLEKQYKENQQDLLDATNALKEFQLRTGIIEVEGQAKASIEAIALLKQKLTELELQKNLIQIQNGNSSAAYKQIATQLAAVKVQYEQFVSATDNSAENPFYSIKEYPDLIQEYAHLYREVVVQQKVYELIYPMYIQQVTQTKNANSGILTIDQPSFPTYKDSPKRIIIMAGGFIAGFIFGLIHALFGYFVQNSNDTVKEKLRTIGLSRS